MLKHNEHSLRRHFQRRDTCPCYSNRSCPQTSCSKVPHVTLTMARTLKASRPQSRRFVSSQINPRSIRSSLARCTPFVPLEPVFLLIVRTTSTHLKSHWEVQLVFVGFQDFYHIKFVRTLHIYKYSDLKPWSVLWPLWPNNEYWNGMFTASHVNIRSATHSTLHAQSMSHAYFYFARFSFAVNFESEFNLWRLQVMVLRRSIWVTSLLVIIQHNFTISIWAHIQRLESFLHSAHTKHTWIWEITHNNHIYRMIVVVLRI